MVKKNSRGNAVGVLCQCYLVGEFMFLQYRQLVKERPAVCAPGVVVNTSPPVRQVCSSIITVGVILTGNDYKLIMCGLFVSGYRFSCKRIRRTSNQILNSKGGNVCVCFFGKGQMFLALASRYFSAAGFQSPLFSLHSRSSSANRGSVLPFSSNSEMAVSGRSIWV